MTWVQEYRRKKVPLWERVIERAIGMALVAGSVFVAVYVVGQLVT